MKPMSIDEKQIDELLSRSVVGVLPTKDLLKKELLSGRQLRIYIGADATGSALHIGHATNYMILEKLRKLGHKVIVLVGDFTARIGDPTDKTAARVQLTRDQVVENTKTWMKQLEPILGFNDKENPVEIVYNNDWLSKMNFEDVINLASNFTVQRMLERDMFEKRIKEEKPIYLHEFFYPLMQGYDSVHLDVDIEICGNDQTFNALAGRTLMQRYKNKEKFVFVTTLLENPLTKEKMMSKSQGTGVFLDMSANDMYGKVMAQPDANIPQLFTDCTYLALDDIQKIKDGLKDGTANPREIKGKLAFEITKIYHSEAAAKSAEEAFIATFAKGGVPDDILEIRIDANQPIADMLISAGVIASRTEWRRLITDGAVRNEKDEKITDPAFVPTSGTILKIGKRRFVKVL
ncbi:MAG: tyrosine--tRNA ligase [Patescibacteria group bacterium]